MAPRRAIGTLELARLLSLGARAFILPRAPYLRSPKMTPVNPVGATIDLVIAGSAKLVCLFPSRAAAGGVCLDEI